MLGELYEAALAGAVQAEVEHSDGTRIPLDVDRWLETTPGDVSLVDRCSGATLDVEENYLMKKLFTAGLGIVSVENQARI